MRTKHPRLYPATLVNVCYECIYRYMHPHYFWGFSSIVGLAPKNCVFVNGPYDTAITRSTYVMTLIYTAAELLSLVYQVPGRYFLYVVIVEGVVYTKYEVYGLVYSYTW